MYSYQERLRAVQLYIKLGKRIAATRRQLGYPTKNTLKFWYREYQQCQDLRQSARRSVGKYDLQQKQTAIKHYLQHGRCAAHTLRRLGYPKQRETLMDWLEQLHPAIGKRLVGQAVNIPKELEIRQQAVIALCTKEHSMQAIAQKVGVCRQTLYTWKNTLLGPNSTGSMQDDTIDLSQLPAEIEKLKQEQTALQRNIRRLRLQNAILEKTAELIKKGKGVDQQPLSNREKTQLVDALRPDDGLPELLEEVQLARSSYFYQHARGLACDKYTALRQTIKDIFTENHRCYGYRRIRAVLSKRQVALSEKVVRRLMLQEGLVAATARRRRLGSYLGEISPAPENIIARNFQAAKPNEKWLTDMTEFHIPAGKVYLSPIIDCFDGLVVSWSIGKRPTAELVNCMLDAAIETLNRQSHRPVIHSDRGAHYRWPGWLTRTSDAGLVRSMSRKGCSPDNAACEGFFGRLKIEMFYSRNWQAVSLDQFIAKVDQYIRWYNKERIKLSLGARSPLEYRQSVGIAA